MITLVNAISLVVLYGALAIIALYLLEVLLYAYSKIINYFYGRDKRGDRTDSR
jgi:hypothetical protein